MTDAENIEFLESLLQVSRDNNKKHLAMIAAMQKDAAIARFELKKALRALGEDIDED